MCNPNAKNVVEKFKRDGADTYARCRETKTELPDGSVDYSYLYTIRTRYKDAILLAHRRIEERIRI